jgi:hypothetical protein
MSETTASLHDCIKELLSDIDKVSHVTFFVEKEGMVRVAFNEFVRLTDDIRVNSKWLFDYQKLLSIFGDNFCFVYNDGYIRYIYAIDKDKEDDYGVIGINPVGENARWDSYDDEHKRSVIRNSLRSRLLQL